MYSGGDPRLFVRYEYCRIRNSERHIIADEFLQKRMIVSRAEESPLEHFFFCHEQKLVAESFFK